MDLGADITIKDSSGHGLVHIASSNGFDSILVYLHCVLGLSFTETDNNGRTPLHLAALDSQTGTGLLLVVWSEDLDLQDIEGFTALHLSVLSQSYKIARNLIIRGADQTIKDNKQETALTVALNRGEASIIKLLVTFMQSPPSCMGRLNPFRQAIGPVSSSYTHIVIFFLISLFRMGLIITVILPKMDIEMGAASCGVFLIGIFGFIVASCKDPGYTKNPNGLDVMDFYDKYRGDYICVYCVNRRPKHARHCHCCRRCVKVRDI